MTYLHLPTIYDDRDLFPILNLVSENCRLLKIFLFVFRPTVITSPTLLNIVRVNVNLNSMTCRVDDNLLEELTSLCSQRLTYVNLYGRVDYNTMVHVLQRFTKIDAIDIVGRHFNVETPTVTYSRSEHCLTLGGATNVLNGWKNFLASIPRLRELKWSGRCFHLPTDDEMLKFIESIEVSSSNINEEFLKLALSKCAALTKLSCSSRASVNWPAVVNDFNKIEKLIVKGPNDHISYLFTAFHYLTELSITYCSISQDVIPSLIVAIRDYRHATSGQTVKCMCDFYYGNDKTKVRCLECDGSKFSGSLWTDYVRLTEARSQV